MFLLHKKQSEYKESPFIRNRIIRTFWRFGFRSGLDLVWIWFGSLLHFFPVVTRFLLPAVNNKTKKTLLKQEKELILDWSCFLCR